MQAHPALPQPGHHLGPTARPAATRHVTRPLPRTPPPTVTRHPPCFLRTSRAAPSHHQQGHHTAQRYCLPWPRCRARWKRAPPPCRGKHGSGLPPRREESPAPREAHARPRGIAAGAAPATPSLRRGGPVLGGVPSHHAVAALGDGHQHGRRVRAVEAPVLRGTNTPPGASQTWRGMSRPHHRRTSARKAPKRCSCFWAAMRARRARTLYEPLL